MRRSDADDIDGRLGILERMSCCEERGEQEGERDGELVGGVSCTYGMLVGALDGDVRCRENEMQTHGS